MARIEASASQADDMLRRGLDIRYVVTSLHKGSAEHIYATLYCARGQAENLIKQHKAQTARIAPVAVRRLPTSSASSCTPPPIGCCSICAIARRLGTPPGKANSPPSACGS